MSKRNKIIGKYHTSKAIFVTPALLTVFVLAQQVFSNFWMSVVALLVLFLPPTVYYFRKVILTDKYVVFFEFNKRTYKWMFESDFKLVYYKQGFVGKLFNYGTLSVVNLQDQVYDYYFMSDPQQCYQDIAVTYENVMVELDQNYQRRFVNE